MTANGGYIWVIANQTTFFTGDDTIPNGGSGTYTLALNGPFIGTVILSDNDTVNGIPQGGTFDNGGTCTFTLANYDPVSNTSTCTFVYTPTVAAEERTITLAPSFPPEFARPMAITPIDITVYGYPDIRFIDPTEGPSTGGNTVWLTGFALQGVSYITFGGVIDDTTDPANPVVVGGVPCTNLRIITEGVLEPIVTCTAPAHPAGQVNVFANNIIPPPDIDNTDPGNPVEIPREPVQYTYFDVATDFVNECSEDGGITWTTTPYVPPGTTVPCQVVLNGRWNGPVELSDDWHTTISPGLSGTFASADGRFDSGTNTFNVQYGDTVDPVGPTVSTGQTLSYTWTSPSWNTLMGYWNPDRSNESDLWWPMINVDIPIDVFENTFLTSTDDNVVFGLLAQSYFIAPDGTYDYYCIECEVDFIVSTYGAPYEGTISITDDLSNSDNPSGTHGEFWAGGVASNPGVIHFAGSDGTDSSFSYIPQTTATPTNAGPPAVPWDVFIRLQGTSSDPAVNNAYYDIAPVKDPGIFIIPSSGCSFIARGQTCSYTLSVTIGTGWSGTIVLNDEFMNGTAGGGVFADASGGGDGNPSGTFSGGNTYTFTAGGGETYERTFTYTLRDDGVVPPTFPSHILQLTATEPVTNAQTFTNLFIDASRVNIGCASSSPNCTIGYVGVLQDYTYTPNGAFMATVSVSASDAGSLGTLTWPTIAATTGTLSYTPQTPGRQVLTATVNTSSIPSMVGQSFTSTGPVPGTSPPVYDPLNLNDYIWVMANQMTITGPSYLRYGATGTFTLTMNGPFIGTVDLNDFLNADGGAAAGGAFSTPSCTFNISDYDSTTNPTGYDSVTNTSSCTFTYTPYAFEDLTNVVLGPSISGYTGPMTRTPLPVTVYGRPIIDTVSPDTGPTTGGTGFGVSHDPNGVIVLTGAGLVTGGSTLNFDSIFMGNIEVDLSSITINPDGSIEFVPPPNAAGEVDITVNAGGRVYHHPGYYTYIPEIDSITPIIGPTTGGTGFGVSYNANGTATITGVGITNAAQYADTTTGQPFSGQQFYQLGWLDFNGSQYINTGVNQLGNTSMTIDATRDSGQYAAGVLVAGHYYTITLPTDGFMFPTAFYGNSNAAAGGAMHLGDRILATLDADGTTADFTVRLNNGATNTNTITPGTPPSTPYNIYLGSANNGAGAAAGMVGRIYSFSINKDLAADDRNMVPVCTMDGTTGGMFDTLHNVFYPSASGTPFACDNSSIPPPTVNFGGTVATNVTAVDLNTIVVVPPAHAEGTVDVNVIVNGITVTLTQAYTYRAPMTVETVFPPTGSQEGGTELIITGHNFIWVDDTTPPALSYTITLDIGGTPAPCIIADVSTDVTNDTIVCTTSAHEAGLVTVTVNNSVETFTMEVVPGPSGNGMPTLDGYGRSTGGFLYSSDFYLEISASDDTLTLNISPSSPFDEGYFDVSVATNNATGYTLFIESEGANLVCVDTGSSSLVIPSTVGNAIDNGTWGFQVGTSPTTNGWAPTPTTPTAIASSSGPTFVTPPAVAEDTQINFAVRDGKPTPISPNCSMYVQNVIHTAVANT
ncbi:IPT/TIG domain-containing protein [Candidatus Saccharibacteria bacterium]|nr:IPT/TIG domain-containing protein [Candidatus Saccharibacteria bacterium]